MFWMEETLRKKVEGTNISYDSDHKVKQDHLCPSLNPSQHHRRKHRGKRGGIKHRLRSRPLPSILRANVQVLDNKLEDLRARISFQQDIRNCNVLCFTKTWLNPGIPDSAIQLGDSFSLYRSDTTEDSGKKKGASVCFVVNKDWCDIGNIKILSCSCTPDLELLAIKCRRHYLPREFTSFTITAVYIPSQANIEAALSDLNYSQTRNPDAALIVAGDFNQANIKKVMPEFHQHIDCAPRGMNTLDHCYTPFKDGYRVESRPTFRKTDDAAILLRSKYVNKLRRMPPVTNQVRKWTSQSEAALQIALQDAYWSTFQNTHHHRHHRCHQWIL